MVDASIDTGINFFDTGDIYSGGQSEQMLGKTLGPRRRDVVIATKLGFRAGPEITDAGLSRNALPRLRLDGPTERIGSWMHWGRVKLPVAWS